MSLKYIKQDILSVEEGIIVHQVNTRGIMGGGLAKAIKEKWPDIYQKYKEKCECHGKNLFGDFMVDQPDTSEVLVASLFAQTEIARSQRNTNYAALGSALMGLKEYREGLKVDIVYIPHGIGCGLGGGDWDIVELLIEDTIPDAIICQLT